MGLIFLKLLNMSIAASWLIAWVLVLRIPLKKAPKWLTCALWAIVAFRLVCPFSIESAFSLIPTAETIRVEAPQASNALGVGNGIDGMGHSVNPLPASGLQEGERPEASVWPAFGSGVHQQEPFILQAATAVWLAGTALLLGYAIFRFIALRRKLGEAVPLAETTCTYNRPKESIWVCDEVGSPFILGILKPHIYLSAHMDASQMELVIAHEKAHLKRLDHVWKPFGYLLLAVYWFNPLSWMAYHFFCKDIELACDEHVIGSLPFGKRKDYCQALLACSTQHRVVMACPLAFGEVGLKERVKNVLQYKKPQLWSILAALLLCLLVGACFLTDPEKDTANTQGQLTSYTIFPALLAYEDMSYSEYQALNGAEMELYHADRFVGQLPGYDVEIVMAGTYDEELAGYKLTDESRLLRFQGKLSSLMDMDAERLSVEELTVKMAQSYGLGLAYDYQEGAGTAYYISEHSVAISFDSDADGNNDALLEVSLDHEAADGVITQASYAWLSFPEGQVKQANLNSSTTAFSMTDTSSASGTLTLRQAMDRVLESTPLTDAIPIATVTDYPEGDQLYLLDQTADGRYALYGFHSEEYAYTGMLVNDKIDGVDHWNYLDDSDLYSWLGYEHPQLVEAADHGLILTYCNGGGTGIHMERFFYLVSYETGSLDYFELTEETIAAQTEQLVEFRLDEKLQQIQMISTEKLLEEVLAVVSYEDFLDGEALTITDVHLNFGQITYWADPAYLIMGVGVTVEESVMPIYIGQLAFEIDSIQDGGGVTFKLHDAYFYDDEAIMDFSTDE